MGFRILQDTKSKKLSEYLQLPNIGHTVSELKVASYPKYDTKLHLMVRL